MKTTAQNKLLNDSEINECRVKLASKPLSLLVALTSRCNLQCKMCSGRSQKNEIISPKVKKEIISLFPYLEKIAWGGGEVFLYPDFNELLDEAARYSIKQEITTNGLLMTEEYAEKFVKYNISLNISIDGTTKEVYESIRQGAKFEELISKLELINKIKNNIDPAYRMRLNVVVMKDNYHQLESFVEFAYKYGFKDIFAFMIFGNNNSQDIFVSHRDNEILSKLKNILHRTNEESEKLGIYFNTNITADILNTGKTEEKPRPGKKAENPARKIACIAPWQALDVDMHGDVSPSVSCCCKFIVGNLNDNSMEEIWNGEKMTEHRKSIVSGSIDSVCTLKKTYGRVPVEVL
jgi:MoaA/NifB/PqqE/SkfB family radical SAM enzyme